MGPPPGRPPQSRPEGGVVEGGAGVGGGDAGKPSYVRTAAPTAVKRPLAQNNPELTSMVKMRGGGNGGVAK